MTELMIFTAGRDDAYDDYQQSVVEGETYDTISGYLDEPLLTKLQTVHDERVPLWCTQQEHYWQRIQPGDEVVFYHNHRLVGRARVFAKTVSLSLAECLWKAKGTTWDDQKPWKFIVFFTDVSEIDVPLPQFNHVFGYKPNYIPKGVMCVKAETVLAVERLYGSVTEALDALEAGTATEGVDLPTERSRVSHKQRPPASNPEKGRALQEMYRAMLAHGSTDGEAVSK